MMSSDRTRLQFLEEAIDIYYLQNRINLTNMMKRFGKRFGTSCKGHTFNSSKDVSDFLFTKAQEGKPLLIDFNIGPEMVSSSYEVRDYEKPVAIDPRLWVPREVGQRNAGGHVIVAVGSFISKGKKKTFNLRFRLVGAKSLGFREICCSKICLQRNWCSQLSVIFECWFLCI